MGEYAKFAGKRVKIGTCEDMYYLRADQAFQVQSESGNVTPTDPEELKHLRFRFPWPDEDGTEPGAFDRYDRSVGLYDVSVPEGVEHFNVQFSAHAGYLTSLPCPEGPAATHGLKIHRNGFAGPVKISQQAYRGGVLALICACGGCGAKYNLPTLAEAEPIIVQCRAQADRLEREHRVGPYRDNSPDSAIEWWHKVADRIAAGYQVKVEGAA